MFRRASQVLFALVALCCLSCRPPEDNGESEPSAFDRQDLDTQWIKADSGPWGTLEYRRFFLPLPKIWRETPPRNEKTVWRVPHTSPGELKQRMAASPLAEWEKRLWEETCRVEAEGDGVTIYPSKEFRWALQPESRARIYRWLGKFPKNEALAFPFCFPAGSQKEWFQDCQLRKEVTDAIEHFLYPGGPAVCFADLDLLDEYLASAEERAELLAVLHRQPYCEIRLHVNQTSDLKSLSLYWGEWQRVERVNGKLKKALATHTEAYLPLAQLIPSLPRGLLNTYPPPTPADLQPRADCYWTAFNFFNRTPDSRFHDATFIEEAVIKHHDRVEGRPQFGDIVFLVDERGRPIHAAVFLAADFVYTKNGGHPTKPWVTMKIADMKAAYPLAAPLREIYYRWNPLKDASPAHLTSIAPKGR